MKEININNCISNLINAIYAVVQEHNLELQLVIDVDIDGVTNVEIIGNRRRE